MRAPKKQETTKARYEFKYVITTEQLATFRAKIQEVMEPDPNSIEGGYQINSLYYDTSDLQSYFEKLDGYNHRVKLRLRYYGTLAENPDLNQTAFFLEAKYRQEDLIHKERVRLPSESIPELLEGPLLSLSIREKANPRDQLAAAIIENLVLKAAQEPFCVVSYYREPFVFRLDGSLRVTFDHNIRTSSVNRFLQIGPDEGYVVLPAHLCILEIKFHWAMPLWLLEICQEMGLTLRRYSKYCSSLERLYPNIARREVRIQESIVD